MDYLNSKYFQKNEQLKFWEEHLKKHRLQLLLLLPEEMSGLFLKPNSIKVFCDGYGPTHNICITFYYEFDQVVFERFVWKEECDHLGLWNWSVMKNDQPISNFSKQLNQKTKHVLNQLLITFGCQFELISKQDHLFSEAFSVDAYNEWEKEQWYALMEPFQKQKKKKNYKKIKTNS